ncbi:MAG: UTP--glucose-1-phosphate uridylyltransferase [Patescibacteria group bacterium]
MTIRKAIITSAGQGTRFLPITKTIQKEMLPILNRPIIDHLVTDCISAGITEIIFVVNEHNRQVLHFYRTNQRLNDYLNRTGKSHKHLELEKIETQARYQFVKQYDTDQYGTAVPLKLAKSLIQDEEAFLVLMGDDFLYNPDGQSEVAKMIEHFEKSQADGLVTCITKPDNELSQYGIAKVKHENGFKYLETLVEKPAPGTAPSNLANISKYILTPTILEIIEHQQPNPSSNELYITDSVTELAKNKSIVIYEPQGEYLDGGSVAGWLKANITVAMNNPELRQVVVETVEKISHS